jgi:hypothetical protein
MRTAWRVLVMAVMVGGCASQSGSQQQSSTMASGESAGGGEEGGSSATGAGVTPEQNDAIDALFRRKAPELQSCWTAEYEKTHDRKVEGDITLGMDIQPSGQPSNVRVLKSSLNNQNIVSCVTQTVGGWSFPEVSAPVPYMRTVHLGAQF